MKPKYSICICVKNMGDSVKNCVESIMSQIDESFEILIIDDASTDQTLEILKDLQGIYTSLRYESLPPDKFRKLGFTRNYSFQAARGDWCLFHIDADDVIGPHLKDFVAVVEILSSAFERDMLFAGQQVHMARRSFLLQRGPFRNIYRGEDRDLYERLVLEGAWIVIDHKRFIHRIARPYLRLKVKTIRDLADQTVTDLRKTSSYGQFLIDTWSSRNRMSITVLIFRLSYSLYGLFLARQLGHLKSYSLGLQTFLEYRQENTRTFSAWCTSLNIIRPKEISYEIFP